MNTTRKPFVIALTLPAVALGLGTWLAAPATAQDMKTDNMAAERMKDGGMKDGMKNDMSEPMKDGMMTGDGPKGGKKGDDGKDAMKDGMKDAMKDAMKDGGNKM